MSRISIHWWLILGGLALLFVVRTVETSDWTVGAKTVLAIVTLVSLTAAVASTLRLLTSKRPMTANMYVAVGSAFAGLLLLLLLQVPMERLGIFAAVAVSAGVLFAAVDWLKGRLSSRR